MSQSNPWLRATLKLFVGVTTLFIILELSWRQWVTEWPEESSSTAFVAESLRHLRPCARIEQRDGVATVVGERPDYTGGNFVFPLSRTSGRRRIAVVGESSGAMMVGALIQVLTNPDGSLGLELVNCAVSGSALEHLELRTIEALESRPDVLIVVFGNNWMMQYPTTGWLLRLQLLLRRSRLLTGLAEVFPLHFPQRIDHDERLRSLEGVLRRIVARSEEIGVRVILNTPTANLWFPPADNPEDRYDPRFLATVLANSRGDFAGAIAQLTELLSQQAEPYWHFTLGMWLARSGQNDAARLRLETAIDETQIDLDRRTWQVSELIRRVAHETGATLNDIDSSMQAITRDGILGWDILYDNCHLWWRHFLAEARQLLLMSAPALTLPSAAEAPADDTPILRTLQGLSRTQSERSIDQADRYIDAIASLIEYWAQSSLDATNNSVTAFLGSVEFRDLQVRRGAVIASIAQGYWFAGQRGRALELNQQARDENGVDPWIQLALFRVATDEAGARAVLQRAHEIASEDAAVNFYLRALEH